MNTGKFLTIANAVLAALNLLTAIALLSPMNLTSAMFSGSIALGCYLMMKTEDFKNTEVTLPTKVVSNLRNGFYAFSITGGIGILLNIGQLVSEGDILRGVVGIVFGVLAIIASSVALFYIKEQLTILEEEDKVEA